MVDLAVTETLNGGDLVLNGADLLGIDSIENQPYFAWFGGNPGYPTSNIPQEQSFDWWGNAILFPNNPSVQFNSLLEQKLKTTPLNSAGLSDMQNTALLDLDFIKPYGKVSVDIIQQSVDRVQLSLNIQMFTGGNIVKIVNFKKTVLGDFSIVDFNDDFFV